MKATVVWLAASLALATASTAGADAPADSSGQRRLRLYLDCSSFSCDYDYLKREMAWVDWVSDRADADVHVLLTAQGTGSGGTELRFYVMRPHGGGPAADTLRAFAPVTASDDVSRRLIARTLEAALARDLVGRPEGERLEVSVAPSAPAQAAAPALDRWNHWVYKIGTNGYLNGEHSYRQYYLYSSITASRVTEGSKLGARVSQNYSENRYRFDDGSRFTSITRGWSARAIAVWSRGPRWSAGASANAYASTFSNVDLAVSAGPAVEFDVYPYDESSRRALTFGYQVLALRNDYVEITLFGRTAETLVSHQLNVLLSQKQPWGSLDLGATATQYLHDASKYRLYSYASVDLKLFRGFSLNGYVNASRIRDQLALRRGDASDTDVIARQHQLATSYQFYSSFGITFRFGSIFDTVVNPRLEDTLGGI